MGGPYNPIKTEYGGIVDYSRLMREKRAKAKKAMEEYGLDAVIACQHENCMYLAVGCHGTGADYRYVVFPGTAEPIVHESGMADRAIKWGIPEQKSDYAIPIPPGLLPWNKPAYENQLKKWANQIKSELKANGVDPARARVGIDIADMSRIEALKSAGINVTTDGGLALRAARSIKTKDEIELMRQSCAIVEACFQRVVEVLRPGITEKQLYGEIARVAWRSGAEGLDGGHVSSGPHSYPIAASMSDRIIRPGDIVLIDIFNLSYHGYRTCYYRNFSVGKPTKAQQDAWKKAVETTWDAINQLKPGVSTRDLVRSWPKAEEFGYDKDENSAIMAQWGHGIGLSLYSEAPMISRAWSLDYPEEIKEGMVLAIETEWPTGEITGAYPHGQMLRIEEEVAVTKNGYDLLSQWPIDEITVCWG
jgi:Xaa-Pro aminopeptidase